MDQPSIVIVSGPPGSGKTTLAHALADRLGVPALIRDEIKQGMVLSGRGDPSHGYHDLNLPTLDVFFALLNTLARAGVTVVAEAAFQDKLWRRNLLPLTEIAEIRIIHCTAPTAMIHDRIAAQGSPLTDSPVPGPDSHATVPRRHRIPGEPARAGGPALWHHGSRGSVALADSVWA